MFLDMVLGTGLRPPVQPAPARKAEEQSKATMTEPKTADAPSRAANACSPSAAAAPAAAPAGEAPKGNVAAPEPRPGASRDARGGAAAESMADLPVCEAASEARSGSARARPTDAWTLAEEDARAVAAAAMTAARRAGILDRTGAVTAEAKPRRGAGPREASPSPWKPARSRSRARPPHRPLTGAPDPARHAPTGAEANRSEWGFGSRRSPSLLC